jgi:hypothetical protein
MPSSDRPGRDQVHRRRRAVLRREAAGLDDDQPLRDGVDAEREDHRRHAQPRHADAVDEAERGAARDAERNREPLAGRAPPARRRRRHHAAHGDGPRHREVDAAEQDDEHRAGRDDAEERRDLQLQQQVVADRKLRE